jgi:hypothetical protein
MKSAIGKMEWVGRGGKEVEEDEEEEVAETDEEDDEDEAADDDEDEGDEEQVDGVDEATAEEDDEEGAEEAAVSAEVNVGGVASEGTKASVRMVASMWGAAQKASFLPMHVNSKEPMGLQRRLKQRRGEKNTDKKEQSREQWQEPARTSVTRAESKRTAMTRNVQEIRVGQACVEVDARGIGGEEIEAHELLVHDVVRGGRGREGERHGRGDVQCENGEGATGQLREARK